MITDHPYRSALFEVYRLLGKLPRPGEPDDDACSEVVGHYCTSDAQPCEGCDGEPDSCDQPRAGHAGSISYV